VHHDSRGFNITAEGDAEVRPNLQRPGRELAFFGRVRSRQGPDVTGLQPHTGDWLCDLRPTLSRVRHGIVVTCLLSLVDSSMGGRDEGTASLLAWS
jgi:hypothetical protein